MLEAELAFEARSPLKLGLQQEVARAVPNILFDCEHNQSQSVDYC
jgi:hypothetical protein